MSVCFLVLFFSMSSSHHLALVQKPSSPSGPLLLIPLGWFLFDLEFLQDAYLETLSPQHIYFFPPISTISFMISLIGSAINPVKSYTASGHSFLQQEFIVSILMAFTAFSVTMMAFQWCNPCRHSYTLSVFSSITLTVFPIEYHV